MYQTGLEAERCWVLGWASDDTNVSCRGACSGLAVGGEGEEGVWRKLEGLIGGLMVAMKRRNGSGFVFVKGKLSGHQGRI